MWFDVKVQSASYCIGQLCTSPPLPQPMRCSFSAFHGVKRLDLISRSGGRQLPRWFTSPAVAAWSFTHAGSHGMLVAHGDLLCIEDPKDLPTFTVSSLARGCIPLPCRADMYIDRICIPCLHVGRTYFKSHQRATDARESTTKGLDIRRRSIIFSRIAPIEPRVSTLIDDFLFPCTP